MPTATRVRPPEDTKSQKPASEDPEVREGSEDEGEEQEERETQARKPKRKQAKSKAEGPEDGETTDGDCGSCASGSCDCGPCKAKRGDAVPVAGLSASWVREDLKCGHGAISKGEKCTKGPATQVQPGSASSKGLFGRNFRQELKANSAAMTANNVEAFRRKNNLRKPKSDPGWDRLNQKYKQSEEAQQYSNLWKERETLVAQRKQRNAVVAGSVGAAAIGGLTLLAAMRPAGGRRKRVRVTPAPGGARIFADGFSIDYDQLAI